MQLTPGYSLPFLWVKCLPGEGSARRALSSVSPLRQASATRAAFCVSVAPFVGVGAGTSFPVSVEPSLVLAYRCCCNKLPQT